MTEAKGTGIMTRTKVEFSIWNCRKCGLPRSNMHTHGVPLPREVMENYEKGKAEVKG